MMLHNEHNDTVLGNVELCIAVEEQMLKFSMQNFTDLISYRKIVFPSNGMTENIFLPDRVIYDPIRALRHISIECLITVTFRYLYEIIWFKNSLFSLKCNINLFRCYAHRTTGSLSRERSYCELFGPTFCPQRPQWSTSCPECFLGPIRVLMDGSEFGQHRAVPNRRKVSSNGCGVYC